ncbi:MAG: spondin domain-containing protein [Chloroflexota bacterium]
MKKVTVFATILVSLILLSGNTVFANSSAASNHATSDHAVGTSGGHYRVTIENLVTGQPISPPVAATHNPSVGIFAVGELASDELEAIAENGDQSGMAALLGGVAGVTDVVDVGRPLTPAGSTAAGFSDTVAFNIYAHPGDVFSFAGMLICTNDGIVGLNRATLPHNGTRHFYAQAYDAGTEDNSELSADIVDPCSGIGPVGLAGDPNGNENVAVDTNPAVAIAHHPGVAATGDLLPAHNWNGPIAKVTITRLVNYRINIQNLATGQPISPPVAAMHHRNLSLFETGKLASAEIEAIAENGNQVPAFDLLSGLDGVTDVVDIGRPLTPYGTTAGDFTDNVTFDILASPNDRFSFAGMLICTNDGIVGLDSIKLPRHNERYFYARAYDAGTEDNTELSADLVDPCSGIGPVGLAGDPNGNENDAVDTEPAGVITRHPGIDGTGDLLAAHDWNGPIAKVSITRLHDYRVTIENLATGQPISPPVAVTHDRDANLFKVGQMASDAIEAIAEDGNQALAVDALAGADGVTHVVDVARPLTPSGTAVADFTDNVTFTIQGRFKDRFSFAGMLICTNDGIVGLNSARLPKEGSDIYFARAYDAGTEQNTELSTDLVDPCSGLGPVGLAGDPNGNENAAVDIDPAVHISRHPGIVGVGDLLDAHDWDGPIAKVTITRVSNNQTRDGGDSFYTELSGNGEVPVIETRGRGTAAFRLHGLERGTPRLHYRVRLGRIDNVTAAHIHMGLPNENGPVVAVLFSGGPTGNVRGDLARGIITEADLVGPYAGDFEALIEGLRRGDLYVNVHTTDHPSGELRGQIGQRNE